MSGAWPSRRGPRGHRGVALAIVLWFIAGMSLLVAGIVFTARTDTRLAQVHLERAQATAAGDGAINLLLADIVEGRFGAGEARVLPRARYLIGDQEVAVVALPARWLVDVNAAEPALLSLAMRRGGELSAESASALAVAVVQWRDSQPGAAARPFAALEDLLAVDGMNRTSFESLRDYAAGSSSGAALREADGQSRAILDQVHELSPRLRLATAGLLGPVGVGRAGLAQETSRLRVDAMVERGGRSWLRRRWISLETTGSFPWTIRRSEPARIIPAPRRPGP